MEIKFAESFWKSLKVMSRHQTWWYKTYEVIRYKIPMFFKNLWFFRRQIWEFRGWDYSFNLDLLKRSLEKTAAVIELGHEIDKTRLKKVEKINRLIFLLNNLRESNFIDQAEKELGPLQISDNWLFEGGEDTPEQKKHNSMIFNRSSQIEEEHWNEIWVILKGQNFEEYKLLMDKLKPEEKYENDVWGDWYDGSGIRHWWD